MARIRMIKPEFFDDPDVADVSMAARLCFVGLWTQADKLGLLADDPRRLKVRLFPYDDVDMVALIDELASKGMVIRYSSNGENYLSIPKFTKHQRPHPKEPESALPVPAVEKHGKPGKETANPPESGVLSLDSGIRNLEARRVSVFAPISGTLDPDLADRAGAFCERYAELYSLHRRGARYLPRPALDYTKACELCAVWDNERLERIATVFLKCEEPFAMSGSRTIGQFAAMASWCDDRLREVEGAA